MQQMAASAALRAEFRAMRQNSRRIEESLTVDQLIQWLTTMARTCRPPAKPRKFVQYTNVKL
jgi:hypothetical protein